MRISPSASLKFDDCPYAYKLQYIDGYRSDVVSCNLVFGTVMHSTVEEYLIVLTRTGIEPEMMTIFDEKWTDARSSQTIEYGANMDGDALKDIGLELCNQFPEAWRNTGLMVLIDDDGKPLLESKLIVKKGAITLSMKLDALCMNSDGEIVVLDFKTPRSPSTKSMAIASDQLTAYQIGVESIAKKLGIHKVHKLGFMELIKNKVGTPRGRGPYIAPLELVNTRSVKQKNEYLQKLYWMAEDVERGRLPRQARMAHNSPCKLCDLANLCQSGNDIGLVKSEYKQKPVEALL